MYYPILRNESLGDRVINGGTPDISDVGTSLITDERYFYIDTAEYPQNILIWYYIERNLVIPSHNDVQIYLVSFSHLKDTDFIVESYVAGMSPVDIIDLLEL